jgi:hypothetical protein
MALHQAWTAGDTARRGQLVIVVYREPAIKSLHRGAAVASGFPPPPEATARLAEARFAREGGSRKEQGWGVSGSARHPRQKLPGEQPHDA